MKSLTDEEIVNDMIMKLKHRMKTDKVSFKYTKKDGSIRDAVGTLNSEIYGSENEPSGSSKSIPENQVRYFDVNSNGWRSFLVENFIDAEL